MRTEESLPRGRPRSPAALAGLHLCWVCKTLKPLDQFYRDKTKDGQRGYLCKPCNKIVKRRYSAIYHVRDKEKISVRRKARYAADPEKERARHRESKKINGAKWEAARRAKRAINPAPNMWMIAKTRAKRRGIEFTIKREDVVVPPRCPVLDIELKVGDGRATPNSPTLDRIDNSKGYVAGNILVVSFRANTIKNDATLKELRAVADFYERLK